MKIATELRLHQVALGYCQILWINISLAANIDSLTLRQNVQRAMNRGESCHQCAEQVSYANFGTLWFKTESEKLIWSECS
ncbi:MAG: Tn3 family transposase [Anaerolineales bacterium]|nr:Tn3 family transposase [Anaerolineales bacterium]